MARKALTAVAVAGVCAALVSGCGSGAKADPDIAWAGTVCKDVGTSGTQLTLPVLMAKEPRRTRDNIAAFLGELTARMGTLETALKSAGPPPSGNGTTAYRDTQRTLSGLTNRLTVTRTKLTSTRVTTQASLTAALKGFGADVSAYSSYHGPVADLRADPLLRSAFDQAPECASLDPSPSASAASSAPPTSSASPS